MSELDDIRAELREIKELLTRPTARPDDFVDAAYIAARTGLKERTVRQGKAGTNVIPRVHLKKEGSRRPVVRYVRRDVDKFVSDLGRNAESPKQRATNVFQQRLRSRRVV